MERVTEKSRSASGSPGWLGGKCKSCGEVIATVRLFVTVSKLILCQILCTS